MEAYDPHALPLALFDYPLDEKAIAQVPIEPRDQSRLMVLEGQRAPSHHIFEALPELLTHGDTLVLNRTQVIPARLRGLRPSGAPVELLLHTPLGGPVDQARRFSALARPAKALKAGTRISLKYGQEIRVVARDGADVVVEGDEPLLMMMRDQGEMPLPPYLKRSEAPEEEDKSRYQSLFAREPGAVAAPTASLHFTEKVIDALKARGVRMVDIVLHVGPGTFLPVRPECATDVRGHVMHKESYVVPTDTQVALKEARAAKKRVIAVGTTALRAVETWAQSGASRGDSQLFVYPGYRCQMVDGLITNFHLPKSTLIMLVAALVGIERLMAAYREALERDYRFFSYGDAMLVLP